MKAALQLAIEQAFQQARQAMQEQRSADAFQWLERAHILTQRQPVLHAGSHWLMLVLGWQTGDYREVDRFMDELRKVTPADVQRAARQYLKDFRFAYVGDASKLDRSLVGQF